MDNINSNPQSLVYADGYSYTEIFEAPETPGMPSSHRLIAVFHALFTSDRESDVIEVTPPATEPVAAALEATVTG